MAGPAPGPAGTDVLDPRPWLLDRLAGGLKMSFWRGKGKLHDGHSIPVMPDERRAGHGLRGSKGSLTLPSCALEMVIMVILRLSHNLK